jgi:hypothetical protein
MAPGAVRHLDGEDVLFFLFGFFVFVEEIAGDKNKNEREYDKRGAPRCPAVTP